MNRNPVRMDSKATSWLEAEMLNPEGLNPVGTLILLLLLAIRRANVFLLLSDIFARRLHSNICIAFSTSLYRAAPRLSESGWKSCNLFTYNRQRTQFFEIIFTQPGKRLLAQPSMYFLSLSSCFFSCSICDHKRGRFAWHLRAPTIHYVPPPSLSPTIPTSHPPIPSIPWQCHTRYSLIPF